MNTIKTVPAGCHAECLYIIGPNDHIANVNLVGYTDPQLWRVDCETCRTCVRAGFLTRADAVAEAERHVARSSEEFWSSLRDFV